MKLKELLTDNRSDVLDKWFKATIATYPAESKKFLGGKKDRFANPVGSNIRMGLTSLYEGLLDEFFADDITAHLDRIIRIRSVQEFSPSEAVSFIYFLKEIISKNYKKEIELHNLHDEIADFYSKIDRLALMAFDNYTECRENLYNIKLRQAKSGAVRLIDRLNRYNNGGRE